MVQIEITPVEGFAAVLTRVLVSFEDVVSGEFDFFLRKSVKNSQQNHSRNPNLERHCLNGFLRVTSLRKGTPSGEIKGLELTTRALVDDFCATLKKKRQRSSRSADVDCLPEPVQDQHGAL